MSAARDLFSLRLLPAAINGLINGTLAWMVHGTTASIGLWTEGAYGIDLLVTGFLLPSISWLIVRQLLRKQAAEGKRHDVATLPSPWLRHIMPTALLGGALVIGAAGTVLGAVAVLALQTLGGPSFSGSAYVAFKYAYSALLAGLLHPTLMYAAVQSLARPSVRTKRP